ncbi:MAG: hypothetical protein U1F43_37690 [Myxococcota bacterium]
MPNRDAPKPKQPARPKIPEVPDTQEALYAPDGVWEVAEDEGEGSRFATPIEMEIEADGLSVVDEPNRDSDE